jgi:hypothetical protein
MLRTWWRGHERRRFQRHNAAVKLTVKVEVYGFQTDAIPFFATGATRNISRGGLLAALDAPVAEGSICKIFLRDSDERIQPQHVCGRVMRCQEGTDGFTIAIAFERPLARLQLEQVAIAVASR